MPTPVLLFALFRQPGSADSNRGGGPDASEREITVKYRARCRVCGEPINVGDPAYWALHGSRRLRHITCLVQRKPASPLGPPTDGPIPEDVPVKVAVERIVTLPRIDACRICGTPLYAGEQVFFLPTSDTYRCQDCSLTAGRRQRSHEPRSSGHAVD